MSDLRQSLIDFMDDHTAPAWLNHCDFRPSAGRLTLRTNHRVASWLRYRHIASVRTWATAQGFSGVDIEVAK